MSIAAILYVIVTGSLALLFPWVGVLAYYLFSVMQMQYLWPHHFGESRVQLILTAATFLGFAGATALKMVDWRRYLTPFMLIMILLVIQVNLAAKYTRFDDFTEWTLNFPHLVPAEIVLSTFNKTLLFFFVACILIDTRKKLEYCFYTFAVILVFYSLWANKVYLTGEFWLFGDNGRLGGPLNSNYFDENYLAMLYVLATPLLYYLGVARENIILRYGIWFFIPISWHALFLTSSRGGMLSLAVVCIYLFFRSFNKKASIGMVVGLIIAVLTQGGLLLNRVDTTVESAETVQELPGERIDPRLISWEVGFKIIRDYPLFGVGMGNFFHAFPNYNHTHPHVAHNTFLQFAADSGIIAGMIYLWIFIMRIPTLFRSAPINGSTNFPCGYSRDYVDDLLNSLFLGFFMVAIFLDLMIYEIFYFLLLMSFAKYCLDRTPEKKEKSMIKSIYKTSDNTSGNRIKSLE